MYRLVILSVTPSAQRDDVFFDSKSALRPGDIVRVRGSWGVTDDATPLVSDVDFLFYLFADRP